MKNVAKRAENKVTAHFTQNLSWTNKAGELKSFNEDQTFTSDTLTEITSRKVGLWLIGVLKHFIKLSRLQGRTGFKMSKPVELELSVNNKSERMDFKFTLAIGRIEGLLTKYPALVTEAFQPAPAIGGITREKVVAYFTNGENLVIAPSITKETKQITDAEETHAEVMEVVAPLIAE